MYAKKRRDYVWYVVMGLMVLVCIPLFGPYGFLAVFIGLWMLAFVWLVGDGGRSERIAYLEETIARQEKAEKQRYPLLYMPQRQEASQSRNIEDETAEVWRKVHELRARSKSGMNVPTERARIAEKNFAPFRAKAAEKVNRQISQGAKIENVEEHVDLLARIEYFETLRRASANIKEDLEKRHAAARAKGPLSPRKEADFALREARYQADTERYELQLAQYKPQYANLQREAGIEGEGNT